MAAVVTSRNDSLEVIEWDIPISEMQSGDNEINFGKLSLGTEFQNKMWESENQMMMNSFQTVNNGGTHLDLNENVITGSTYQPSKNGNIGSYTAPMPSSKHFNESAFSRYQPAQLMQHQAQNTFAMNSQLLQQNNPVISPNGKPRVRNQPLLQSPVSMPNERSPNLLSQQEGNPNFDERRLNESQTIKEELLEMKSIFTKLAANSEDILGLPEPVQLALKVIKLEGRLQDQHNIIKSYEEQVIELNSGTEKMKNDQSFELEKQKREVLFLQERLDYKTNLDAKLKDMTKTNDEKLSKEEQEMRALKDELQTTTENKNKVIKELQDWKHEAEHKMSTIQLDKNNNSKELQRLKTALNEQKTTQQNKKTELEKYITAAREAMERERQDRYLLLVEQNKLKHKVEKLSETCKSYQLKNEELCRIQNELEQECDQFRKLKKMIQEHGLPNHEQLILLQQQTEMFKDDVLSERKDRERAQAQREKLRRDLEILQSRNQSLQEQVYKYQEHIMRLNTTPGGRQQQQQPPPPPDFPQNNGKFARQLSSPAYYNPKIRAPPGGKAGGMATNGLPPGGGLNRQDSPVGDLNRNGYQQNNYQPRGGGAPGLRHSPNFVNNVPQFDPWQQRQLPQQSNPKQQQMLGQQQQRNNINNNNNNTMANMNNRAPPRSPLLGPNGDPWMLPPSSNNNGGGNQQQQTQQQQSTQIAPNNGYQQQETEQQHSTQLSSGISYSNNIWSQQAPASPTAFHNNNNNNNNRSGTPTTNQSSSSPSPSTAWQFNAVSSSVFTSSKAVPGGETWSTATASDENAIQSSQQQDNQANTSTSSSSSSSSSSSTEYQNQEASSPGGFQCGKCNMKFHDTDQFRGHVEKCFN